MVWKKSIDFRNEPDLSFSKNFINAPVKPHLTRIQPRCIRVRQSLTNRFYFSCLKFKSKSKISNTFAFHGSVSANEKELKMFFNQCFDKGRLKNFVLWFLLNYGENKTVRLVEQLKNVGFYYASKAGISLGVDDLKIPPRKANLILEAEKLTTSTIHQYMRGEITGVERFQRLIDTWHRTSEVLKQEVIDHFEATDVLNPVYMMAFSGARGNISQVRQLVGMRGLMADPQGEILDFPIRSNFREGLTLTEYIISSYGARKGIVDTALRTANAGYLTRRLVDVAQHVIISNFDCGTKRGIFLTNMKEGNKTIHSLSQRIVGRILARDLYLGNTQLTSNSFGVGLMNQQTQANAARLKIASRNEEVTADLAFKIGKSFDKIFVRSSLTCEKLICQLCYGWSLAQGKLVSIGEAVGVVAAQSIGEPGTQLTMRTFHTGGVFSGDISDQIKAPYDGIIEYISAIPGTLIRTPEGKIAFLTKGEGSFIVHKLKTNEDLPFDENSVSVKNLLSTASSSKNQQEVQKRQFKIPPYTLLYMRNGQNVYQKEVIAQISFISQKTNATDDAELTIKSEIEGQFYSKSLAFRERMVGPKIQKSNPSNTVFYNLEYDTIYESWTWGYAWILSGKIYEFKKPSHLFPIIGDLLNTKSYLTQTNWSLNYTNPKPQQTFKNHSFHIASTSANNLIYEFNKRTPTNSHSHFSLPLFGTSSNSRHKTANVTKSYPIKNSQVLLFDLNNIFYKKYGYVFELSKKKQFISFFKNTLTSTYTSPIEINKNRKQTTEIENLDLLFFIKVPSVSSLYSKEKSMLMTKTKNHSLFKSGLFEHERGKSQASHSLRKKEEKLKQDKFYNKKYLEQFPYFLQWFPTQYKTKTSGTAIFENVNFPTDPKKNTLSSIKLQGKARSNKNLNHFYLKSNIETNTFIRKKEHLFIKERLIYLKKRPIQTCKILWVPSLFFKVSNFMTHANFMQLYSNNFSNTFKDQLNSGINTNNFKLFIALFLNKKMQFLQTNRQGSILFPSLGSNSFDHHPKNSLYSDPAKKAQFLDFSTKQKMSKTKFYASFEPKLLTFLNPKSLQNQRFFSSIYDNYLTLETAPVSNTLVKMKKSILNRSTFIMTQSFFRKRKNTLTPQPLLKKQGLNNPIFFNNSNFTTLKLYCTLAPSFTQIFDFNSNNNSNSNSNSKYINAEQHVSFSVFLNLFTQMNNNKKYKQLAIKQNRTLSFLKSIYAIYPYFNPKLSNFLEQSYEQFSLIKNKQKFQSYLSKSLPCPTLTHQTSQNIFSIRAKTNFFNSFDSVFSPYHSFGITQTDFNHLKPINNSKNTKQSISAVGNQVYHANVKKGWVFITTPSFSNSPLQNKSVWDFMRVDKKIIYPGQLLFKSTENHTIQFNTPILAESFLLNPTFDITNISSLSTQKTPYSHFLQINSYNHNHNHNHNHNPNDYHDHSNNGYSNVNINAAGTTNKENSKSNPNNKLLEQLQNPQKDSMTHTKLRWVKNNKSRFYILKENNAEIFYSPNSTVFNTPDSVETQKYNQQTDKVETQEHNQGIGQKQNINTENQYMSSLGNLSCEVKPNVQNTQIGFLFQPIEEFEQMSNFDFKNYAYQSSQTTFNFSNHQDTDNKNLDSKIPFYGLSSILYKQFTQNFKVELNKQDLFYLDTFALTKAKEGKKGLKSFLISLDKTLPFKTTLNYKGGVPMAPGNSVDSNPSKVSDLPSHTSQWVGNVENNKNSENKDGFKIVNKNVTLLNKILKKAIDSANFSKPNKVKKQVFINQSFDSLGKKRFYRSKKPSYNINNRKNIGFLSTGFLHSPYSADYNAKLTNNLGWQNQIKNTEQYIKSKTIKKTDLIGSLSFLFTKSKDLIKAFSSHSKLFTNKTFFKPSDWKSLGLLQNNIYFNSKSYLQPKSPKEDFNVISNVLIQNYIQQYHNSELLFNNVSPFFATASPQTKTNQKNYSNELLFQHHFQKFQLSNPIPTEIGYSTSPIFMVSKKALNLSPFLLCYKNLANLPMSFNKKQQFKLSYSPISNFDRFLYPSLASNIKDLLNPYLINSVTKTVVGPSFTSRQNGIGQKVSRQKTNSFYGSFHSYIPIIFESPCFTFNLTQSFDFSTFNQNQTEMTQFFYNNNSLSILSKTSPQRVSEADAQTYYYSPFEGELVYTQTTSPFRSLLDQDENRDFMSKLQSPNNLITKTSTLKQSINDFITQTNNSIDSSKIPTGLPSHTHHEQNKVQTSDFSFTNTSKTESYASTTSSGSSKTLSYGSLVSTLHLRQQENSPFAPFSYSCMILTKQNLVSYYLPTTQKNLNFRDFSILTTQNSYQIKDTLIKFLTMTEIQDSQISEDLKSTVFNKNNFEGDSTVNIAKMKAGNPQTRASVFRKSKQMQNTKSLYGFKQALLKNQIKSKPSNSNSLHRATSLLGDFYVFGDSISDSSNDTEQAAVRASGQIVHYNNKKVTLRRGQPIFISPKGVLHKFDGEFIDAKVPVITLSYQRLKTGDIIQGIPKVEQFFEARTTKRGRLFRDSLPSLLKALFKRYQSKMAPDFAVRQSFYKIQQIIVDGVHRVYKSQGVTISDKHLEVIVKQMTSKVRILDGAQTGFFPGEVVDLFFVEKINDFLIKKITYEPLVLGITKASLEVDSFLSAASFQQTTKVLSQAAIYRKKDFLKGLKENVILGNLIPAGTGYLVYLDDISSQ